MTATPEPTSAAANGATAPARTPADGDLVLSRNPIYRGYGVGKVVKVKGDQAKVEFSPTVFSAPPWRSVNWILKLQDLEVIQSPLQAALAAQWDEAWRFDLRQMAARLLTGNKGGQLGNAIHCKPHGPNDWLYVVVQEVVWDALATKIGGESFAKDPRYATIAERRKHQNDVWKKLNEFAASYTKRELMKILNDLDVPCGPIMGTADLADDEHVRGRQMWVELDHPQRGKWFNVGMPIKLSASPARIERSPLLGEHTETVLKEVLGYSEERITQLKRAGAFSMPPKKAA